MTRIRQYVNVNMSTSTAVAYLRECDVPPLWPDHENFLQSILYEKVLFCHFPARIAKFNNV